MIRACRIVTWKSGLKRAISAASEIANFRGDGQEGRVRTSARKIKKIAAGGVGGEEGIVIIPRGGENSEPAARKAAFTPRPSLNEAIDTSRGLLDGMCRWRTMFFPPVGGVEKTRRFARE